MRRRKKFLRLLWPTAAATAAMAFPGCQSAPTTTTPPASAAPAEGDRVDPADTTAGEVERYAQQVQAALGQRETLPPAEVQWLTPGVSVGGLGIDSPRPLPTPNPPAPSPAVVVETPEPVIEAPPPAPSPRPQPLTRDELLRELRQRIAEGEASDLAKAIDAALVSVLDPASDLDRTLLEPLGYEQKDLVERYHHVMDLLAEQLKSTDAWLDRDLIDARLDELFGHMPIRIRRTELCRRVTGFGVYEPFEKRTFLAGRDNKMIVYVELDQFRPSETGEQMYEVKLQQELALFNESDGLAVWRNEPVQIVDTSRNRRRDFFVVQLVTLPARLSVGKYRLKVRVTDLHGGSVDETSIPIEIVADEAMVQGKTPVHP